MIFAGIEQVAAADWTAWLAETGGALLDVREPHEWRLGTLPDAMLVSLGDLPSRLGTLDPETPLLIVCRSGNRSQVAAAFLARSGFRRVANLTGGMKALGLAA
jgi:rhodanese-related sulfurtransferase